MNIEITNYEDLASEFSNGTNFEKRKKRSEATPANRSFRKRGKGPQQFNGMHRRRTKKIKW